MTVPAQRGAQPGQQVLRCRRGPFRGRVQLPVPGHARDQRQCQQVLQRIGTALPPAAVGHRAQEFSPGNPASPERHALLPRRAHAVTATRHQATPAVNGGPAPAADQQHFHPHSGDHGLCRRPAVVAVIIGGYAFWAIGSGLGHQPVIVGARLTAAVKLAKSAKPAGAPSRPGPPSPPSPLRRPRPRGPPRGP